MENSKDGYSYELIQDYLNGILDSKTSRSISSLIKNDETARDIAKGILILQEKFDEVEIDDYLNEMLEINQNVIKANAEKNVFLWVKMAAAVAFLIISGLVIFHFIEPDLSNFVAQEMSVPYAANVVFRDGETSALSNAFTAYSNKDYEKALNYFNKSTDVKALFYKGLCHLYLGDFQLAITVLDNEELIGSRFEEQSRWYTAMAYVEAGDEEKAREVLNEIIKHKGHYKYKKAVQLIKLVDE